MKIKEILLNALCNNGDRYYCYEGLLLHFCAGALPSESTMVLLNVSATHTLTFLTFFNIL